MENSKNTSKSRVSWLTPTLLLLVLAALVVALILNWSQAWALVTDPQALKAWITGWGPWAPAVYVVLNFLLGVTVIMPGEVPMIAGGFLFGVWWGTLWASLGTALATLFCFAVARRLGLAFVVRLFGQAHVDQFEKLVSGPRAIVVFFFLFLIPGLPKHILSYLGGLTKLNIWVFLVVSLVGHTPALVGAMLIGEATASANWTLVFVIGGLAVGCLVLGLVFQKPLMAWLARFSPQDSPESTKQP